MTLLSIRLIEVFCDEGMVCSGVRVLGCGTILV